MIDNVFAGEKLNSLWFSDSSAFGIQIPYISL